jgi:GNAT superfamily N-acetyltransferase
VSSVRIAPARTFDELATVAEIDGRVAGEEPPGADALAHELESDPRVLFLLAYAGDEAAGAGVGLPSSLPGCLYAMARVLPERRRRGMGAALYEALSEHARAVGRDALVGRVREDDADSRRFVDERGFRELSRECPVALHLDRVAAPPADPPAGVEIASLAARPELVRAAYEVEAETVGDIPLEPRPEPKSYEEWLAASVETPAALLDACFVALADGEVVGWAALQSLSDGAACHDLTAVRRPWRGRGIALALKRAQVAWAKEHGYRRLLTSNDEANAAMRAVNARLGYEPEPVMLLMRGPLFPGGV